MRKVILKGQVIAKLNFILNLVGSRVSFNITLSTHPTQQKKYNFRPELDKAQLTHLVHLIRQT